MLNGRRVASYLSMLVMGGALLLSGIMLSQTSFAEDAGTASGKAQTLVGTISDTMCGATHHMADAAKCTLGCTSKGAGFALVVGDKVYKLAGKTAGLDKLAGAKAKVSGTVNGDTITVKTVVAG